MFICSSNSVVAKKTGSHDEIGITDVVYLINHLFKSRPVPIELKEGDVNCDNDVTISDAVYLVNYLFKSGPQPLWGLSKKNHEKP